MTTKVTILLDEAFGSSAYPAVHTASGVQASLHSPTDCAWALVATSSDQLRALAAAATEAAERFDALAHSQALAAREQTAAPTLPAAEMDVCAHHPDRPAAGGTVGPDGAYILCTPCLDEAMEQAADEHLERQERDLAAHEIAVAQQ